MLPMLNFAGAKHPLKINLKKISCAPICPGPFLCIQKVYTEKNLKYYERETIH